MTLKLCLLIEYEIKNIFMENKILNNKHFHKKTMPKMSTKSKKLVLDPFLILVNSPKQTLHARNSFENKIF